MDSPTPDEVQLQTILGEPDEFQLRISRLKQKVNIVHEEERRRIEQFGFVVKAYSDHAYTKALVINGKPILIAARNTISPGMKLAEAVGIIAGHLMEYGEPLHQYPLPFGPNLPPELNRKNEVLRNKLIKVEPEDFNRYAHAAAMVVAARPEETVYVLLIGDMLNLLPGEEGYTDIGQYRLLPKPEEKAQDEAVV